MARLKTVLKIGLPLLLGVALVWFSLSQVPLQELVQYFKNANYVWIGLGVFFGLMSHLSRAYRWRFLIEPLGYKLRLPNSIMAVFATYLINYTIPRAGEIARASILTNYEGVPFEKGFGTIVAERVADLLVLIAIIVFTMYLEYDFIYSYLIERFNTTKLIIACFLVIVIMISLTYFVNRSSYKLATKIKSFLIGLKEGVLSIFKMKNKWEFIGHTIFIWAMYVLMFYITTFAIPETSNIPLAAVFIGFIAASFSIAATNGGIGSYPVAIYLAFSIFNIAKEPSIAFGWIVWTSQTLMVIILGGISLIYLPIYNRNNKRV